MTLKLIGAVANAYLVYLAGVIWWNSTGDTRLLWTAALYTFIDAMVKCIREFIDGAAE